MAAVASKARSGGATGVTVGPETTMERELAADKATGQDRIARLPTPAHSTVARVPKSAGRKVQACR